VLGLVQTCPQSAAGFMLSPGEYPIIPVMFADEHEAAAMADALLELGVCVIAFSYPVVPLGKARIRVQLSAAQSSDDIIRCTDVFASAREASSAKS
jgi:glycine C-acetyltransferase